jgi:uncharacterized membrane protein
MPYVISVYVHVAIGTLALLLYWIPLLSRKGGRLHRAWGKRFFVTLLVVAITIGPVLFLRPGAFEPAFVIQFTYLSLCVLTVVTVGWTAIRWKADVERFRGRHFKILAIVIFLLGGVVLLAGAVTGNGVAMLLSWVGLVYGSAMMWFAWMTAEPHPKWWLTWHLHAVCGLFEAVHGTVLWIAWRTLIDPQAGVPVELTIRMIVLLTAIALRIGLGYKYKVPLGSAKATARRARAAQS